MARRKKRSGSPSQLHPLTAAVLLGLSAPPSPAMAQSAPVQTLPEVKVQASPDPGFRTDRKSTRLNSSHT